MDDRIVQIKSDGARKEMSAVDEALRNVFSDPLWRQRDPSAEDLLRQMMIESTGPALDRALFSAAAATAGVAGRTAQRHRADPEHRRHRG